MQFILDAANYVLSISEVNEKEEWVRNGKRRFKENVTRLSHAFALPVTHPDSLLVRYDLTFFQAIKARPLKFDETKRKRSNR